MKKKIFKTITLLFICITLISCSSTSKKEVRLFKVIVNEINEKKLRHTQHDNTISNREVILDNINLMPQKLLKVQVLHIVNGKVINVQTMQSFSKKEDNSIRLSFISSLSQVNNNKVTARISQSNKSIPDSIITFKEDYLKSKKSKLENHDIPDIKYNNKVYKVINMISLVNGIKDYNSESANFSDFSEAVMIVITT